ncbi:MAG: GAF domain-containing protein [Mesorhizobium sp.]|nr:MAG: GAF domain-containing protein [Mesorhizobium sp.]
MRFTVGDAMGATAHQSGRLRLELLAALGDRIREIEDPGELAYSAAELLGRHLEVSRAGYGTIDPEEDTISIDRDWNAPGIKSLAGTLKFRDYGSYIDDLKRGEIVIFEDAETDPRTRDRAEALKALSARSLINMPVSEHGKVVALLYLNNAAPRRWSDDESTVIFEVAERTRTAIERLRAERALQETTDVSHSWIGWVRRSLLLKMPMLSWQPRQKGLGNTLGFPFVPMPMWRPTRTISRSGATGARRDRRASWAITALRISASLQSAT